MPSFSINKKSLVSGLILAVICLGIFSNVFYQTVPVRAETQANQPDPNAPGAIGAQAALKAQTAGAQGPGGIIWDAIASGVQDLSIIWSWIATAIIQFEAGILNYILNPANFPMTTAPIVKTGWDVSRTTVNMFFVLVLLVVAFATILRIETYNIKAVLPRLIIVAFLINFSLVIAGALIDFANVITNFFYGSITQKGYSDLSMQLASGLSIAKLFKPNPNLGVKFTGIFVLSARLDVPPLAMIAGGLLTVFYLLVTIFIFAAMIVLLFIRVLTLWILLILAPIAWFFYIIPALQGEWYKWWRSFFKWVFFAPASMFFIFLSLTTLKNIGDNGTYNSANLQTEINKFASIQQYWPTADPIAVMFQFLLAASLIVGSLIVAQSMSITGADHAVKLGKSLGTGAAKWSARRAGRALTWGQKEVTTAEGKKVQMSLYERTLKRIATVPGVGQIARPGYTLLQKQQDYITKRAAERFEKMPEERRAAIYDRSSKEEQAAIQLARLKDKSYKKLSDDEKGKLGALKLMEKYGFVKERMQMLKLDPNIVYKMTTDPTKQTKLLTAILKEMKGDDWKDMDQKLWTDPQRKNYNIAFAYNTVNPAAIPDMLRNLGPAALEANREYIRQFGNTPQTRETMFKQQHQNGDKIIEYLKSVPGQQRAYRYLFDVPPSPKGGRRGASAGGTANP